MFVVKVGGNELMTCRNVGSANERVAKFPANTQRFLMGFTLIERIHVTDELKLT